MTRELTNCQGCHVTPGSVHILGCPLERCSVDGLQRITCALKQSCPGHDRRFSRYIGIFPGIAEAEYLGLTLNELYATDVYKALFIKPKKLSGEELSNR